MAGGSKPLAAVSNSPMFDTGVFKNMGTPKWMIYNGKPIRIDDLGVPLFLETSICGQDCWINCPKEAAMYITIKVNSTSQGAIARIVSQTPKSTFTDQIGVSTKKSWNLLVKVEDDCVRKQCVIESLSRSLNIGIDLFFSCRATADNFKTSFTCGWENDVEFGCWMSTSYKGYFLGIYMYIYIYGEGMIDRFIDKWTH